MCFNDEDTCPPTQVCKACLRSVLCFLGCNLSLQSGRGPFSSGSFTFPCSFCPTTVVKNHAAGLNAKFSQLYILKFVKTNRGPKTDHN